MKKCSYCGAEYPDDVIVCALDQTALDNPAPSPTISWPAVFAWGGLIVGIMGTSSVALISYPIFRIHQDIGPGTMLWLAVVFITAIWTFLIGLPCAIIGIVKRRRLVGWLGVAFAIAPAPLGLAMLKTAMLINGFHIHD
jgi:hypothetical protein